MAKNKKVKGISQKIEIVDFKPCKYGEFVIEYSETTKRFSLKSGDKFIVSDVSSSVIFSHAESLGINRESFKNI